MIDDESDIFNIFESELSPESGLILNWFYNIATLIIKKPNITIKEKTPIITVFLFEFIIRREFIIKYVLVYKGKFTTQNFNLLKLKLYQIYIKKINIIVLKLILKCLILNFNFYHIVEVIS